MAGGKLSPRQKMINLMYLVFIAMLALNMSKEVLTAFGLMNEKFENILLLQSILFHHLFCFCFNFEKISCFFKFKIII